MRLLNQQERPRPSVSFSGGQPSASSVIIRCGRVGIQCCQSGFCFVAQPLSYPPLSVQMNEKSSSVGTGHQCFRPFYTFFSGAVAVAQGGAVCR